MADTLVKSKRCFYNASASRYFTLAPRPGDKKEFLFAPGATVEAIDDREAELLAGYFDVKDVAKMTQTKTINDDLANRLNEEAKKNAALMAENAALKNQVSGIKAKGSSKKG